MWLFSGASGKGMRSPCLRSEVGAVSTFVIIKLGLELLSLAESDCVHTVLLPGRSCKWAVLRLSSAYAEAAKPVVCTPFSSVDPAFTEQSNAG